MDIQFAVEHQQQQQHLHSGAAVAYRAMAGSETAEPSDRTLQREISMFLRAAEEPDALTFKQVGSKS